MIRVLNLDFAYEPDGGQVLWDINIAIKPGEFAAILGPNGSGKSTLIKHFNALLLPMAGEVEIDGLDTRERRNHKKIRELVSLIFQNPLDQFIGLNVFEDMAVALRMRGDTESSVVNKVTETLEKFGLAHLKDRYPHNISGGEQKLLSIAAASITDPKVILLDEPTVMLDMGNKKKVHDHIVAFHNVHNKTVVVATTDPNEAKLAQRIYVINKGRIISDGTPQSVFKDKKAMDEMGIGVPDNGSR